jgi:GNAT superfamily N-acetyltransferase
MDYPVLIRPARLSDAEAIAGIWRQLGWLPWHNQQPLPVVIDTVARQLEMNLSSPNRWALAAEHELEGVVGYTAVHLLPTMALPAPEAYVSELFVAQGSRGKGVGRRLLDEVVKKAKDLNCSRLMLFTDRDRESYKRGFYAGLDWQERPDKVNFILPLMDY